jgi:twitching motility protein PilT
LPTLLPRHDTRGRVLAAEIMVVTKTAQEAIRDAGRAGTLKDIIENGRTQYNMQSFDQHLADLYRAEKISLDTAVHYASNPSDLQRALSFE